MRICWAMQLDEGKDKTKEKGRGTGKEGREEKSGCRRSGKKAPRANASYPESAAPPHVGDDTHVLKLKDSGESWAELGRAMQRLVARRGSVSGPHSALGGRWQGPVGASRRLHVLSYRGPPGCGGAPRAAQRHLMRCT